MDIVFDTRQIAVRVFRIGFKGTRDYQANSKTSSNFLQKIVTFCCEKEYASRSFSLKWVLNKISKQMRSITAQTGSCWTGGHNPR